MDQIVNDRVALNEATFRSINETLSSGRYTASGDGSVIGFVCECGDPTCSEPIDVERARYEAVRRNPRRFLIVAGHEIPEAEDVVDECGGVSVVQKRGSAGGIAEVTDPRA